MIRNLTHEEIQARPKTARLGIWMIARTPVARRYPCACVLGRECKNYGHPGYFCRCWGRPDHDVMPAFCCSRAFRRHPILEGQA